MLENSKEGNFQVGFLFFGFCDDLSHFFFLINNLPFFTPLDTGYGVSVVEN